MALLLQEENKMTYQEQLLFEQLDKGIEDMEHGRIVSHDDAMQIIMERLQEYEL